MEKQQAKRKILQQNSKLLYTVSFSIKLLKRARTKEDSTNDVRKQKKCGKPSIKHEFSMTCVEQFSRHQKSKTRKHIENHVRFYGGAPHSKFLFCSKYSEDRNFEWAAF